MNGYTGIFENRNVTFEEFVWRCARAFGALVHMRDMDWNVPVVLPQQSSRGKINESYRQECLKDSQALLQKYQNMSLAQAQTLLDQEYQRRLQEAKEGIAKKKVLRERFEKVYVKVQSWQPPSSKHNELKQFMLEQLEYGIKHDCDDSYWQNSLSRPKPTVQEWLNQNIAWAQQDVEYHTKKANEEEDDGDSAVEWILALKNSVPEPAYGDKF